MLPGLIIRARRGDDAVAPVTEILHAAYAQLGAMGFRYLATHQDDAMTLRRLQAGWSFFGVVGGEIVATITLRSHSRDSDSRWYRNEAVFSFGQFGVRPDLQRQGIGIRLLAHVEQEARRHGAEELALDTAEGATHLRDWYSRLGYRFIEFVSWSDVNYRSVILSKDLLRSDATGSPTA